MTNNMSILRPAIKSQPFSLSGLHVGGKKGRPVAINGQERKINVCLYDISLSGLTATDSAAGSRAQKKESRNPEWHATVSECASGVSVFFPP